MNEFYEETKTIRAYEVDFNNRLKINSIFNLMQETAAAHADLLGLGFNDLMPHNLAWILSWAKVEIEKYPRFTDTVKIKTWPKEKFKLYSLRDFIFFDEIENQLIKATTAWLPVNIKTKRITDTGSLPQTINYQPDTAALTAYPKKIIHTAAKETALVKTIKYSDLDLNHHTNNTKYIELISDSYTEEFHQNNFIIKLTVSFTSESFYDDEIEVGIAKEVNSDIVSGINKQNNKPVFQASVEWVES